MELFQLDKPQLWDTQLAFHQIHQMTGVESKRSAERKLNELGIFRRALDVPVLEDELGRKVILPVVEQELQKLRNRRVLVLFIEESTLPNGKPCLFANDSRGARFWHPLEAPLTEANLAETLRRFGAHVEKTVAVYPHGSITALMRALPPLDGVEVSLAGYKAVLPLASYQQVKAKPVTLSPHLAALEAESIHILREAVAEADNPAMLYSIGKDSAVMLHLARKAFFPASPPFPLVHVDTRWKFQEMYLMREYMAQTAGMRLITYVNPEAVERNINPFEHGSALHTDITKTQGLKQMLDTHKFDVVFGGARRDEEKSRAKERIFSFRCQNHQWNPKNQRPELWDVYNTRKKAGESIRVFPLSNWTELDIWQYILEENIPVVPLYFAKPRPVVERGGTLIMVDDERFVMQEGEKILHKQVRFRTLGCYPLSGAIESDAQNVEDIILELLQSRSSERQGRLIDSDSAASMEKKKKEGYF